MIKNVLKIIPWGVLLLVSNAFAAVNMAVIAPRAGEFKSFGEELIHGVEIAVNDINAQGGVLGEPVNLIVVDDRCDDMLAVSTAQMMAVNSSAKDKVNVVIGPYCDNAFAEVGAIYAKAGILQIIPTKINKANAGINYGGLVKLTGSSESEGESFYAYYQQNFAGQRVALVYDGAVRTAVDMAALVQNIFRSNGAAQLIIPYDFAAYQDLGHLAEEIIHEGNQLVFILGSSKKIAKLARKLKEESRELAVFTDRYLAGDTFEEVAEEFGEGTYFMALPSLKDSPSFTETLVRLRLQGAEPEGLGVYGYLAAMIWEEAVEKADSLNYKAVAKTFERSRFETPWGECRFESGNPDKAINYGVYRLLGGEYTQVY